MIMIIDHDHDHRDHEFVALQRTRIVRRTMRDMKNKAVAVESMELRGRPAEHDHAELFNSPFRSSELHIYLE